MDQTGDTQNFSNVNLSTNKCVKAKGVKKGNVFSETEGHVHKFHVVPRLFDKYMQN